MLVAMGFKSHDFDDELKMRFSIFSFVARSFLDLISVFALMEYFVPDLDI